MNAWRTDGNRWGDLPYSSGYGFGEAKELNLRNSQSFGRISANGQPVPQAMKIPSAFESAEEHVCRLTHSGYTIP
jgi:hypothetical protein